MHITKLCKCCKLILPISNFNTHSTTKDGLRSNCIECRRLSNIEYRKANPEKMRKLQAKADKKKRSVPLNKFKKLARASCRRASKIRATPKWLTREDLKLIEELYTIAQMFQVYTGQSYHIDHIIPLNNKDVCGLHIPCNLRVILAKENLTKNNSFDTSLGIDYSAQYYC